MKILALFLFVAVASASFYDDLDDAAHEIAQDFMESGPTLQDVFLLASDEDEESIRTELGKHLKEALDRLLERIKERIDLGKIVKEDLLEKVKDLKEKLENLHIKISDKTKELLQKVRDGIKELLKKILEKLGLDGEKEKRSVDDVQSSTIRDIFQKLKDAILGKIDKDALIEKIEKLFGKGNELADKLLEILKEKGEKGKQRLLDLVDRLLKDREERSISEMWDKVKEYFDKIRIEIKEKYLKFGKWVKDFLKDKIDQGKTKLEKIKDIAKEFKDHIKEVSKEVAVEGLEFLRPYKEDLGSLWEQIKDAVKEVIHKKE